MSEDAATGNTRQVALKLNLLFVGLSFAIVAVPLLLMKTGLFGTALLVGLAGVPPWVFTFERCLIRQGKRAYWLLLLAPLGFFWPAFIIRWIYGAMEGDPNWMMP